MEEISYEEVINTLSYNKNLHWASQSKYGNIFYSCIASTLIPHYIEIKDIDCPLLVEIVLYTNKENANYPSKIRLFEKDGETKKLFKKCHMTYEEINNILKDDLKDFTHYMEKIILNELLEKNVLTKEDRSIALKNKIKRKI